jgi:nascent polypeptide-associated complex subunit alpha
MRKMGIKQTSVADVIEVVIRTRSNEIVIPGADVVCVDMQGSRSYQISGAEHVRPLGSAPQDAGPAFPEEDVSLVMSQTGCDRDAALKALDAAGGQPAEAILSIMTG